VLNSNYVITLDRIINQVKNLELIDKILNHKNIDEQINEWKELGIIDNSFDKNDIYEDTILGKQLNSKYKHLPIDTKYFKDLEIEILKLFDNLDYSLDGWIIKSENYQALNTILPKFKEKAQTIYIDPPFNTGEDFSYVDRFQDSSWSSLVNDRIMKSLEFLQKTGCCFFHLNENVKYYGKILLNNLKFDNIQEIIYNTNATKDEEADLFAYKSFGSRFVLKHNTIFYCFNNNSYFNKLWKPNRNKTSLNIGWLDLLSLPRKNNPNTISDLDFYIEKYDNLGNFNYEKIAINEKIYPIGDLWTDIFSFTQSEMRTSENLSFLTQKPENLMRRIIQTSSQQRDVIMDFFAGSGTTLAVAQKLNRKWIGIEMGDYFYENYYDNGIRKLGILGRLKNVLYGDKRFLAIDKHRLSHLSNDINWNGGGFFKYYELEQYEDSLKRLLDENYRL